MQKTGEVITGLTENLRTFRRIRGHMLHDEMCRSYWLPSTGITQMKRLIMGNESVTNQSKIFMTNILYIFNKAELTVLN